MNQQAYAARGSLLFAFLFVVLGLFLVSQLGVEAKFSSKGKLFAQPAFWPGVAVTGMAFFGCLHLIATAIQAYRGKYGPVEPVQSFHEEPRSPEEQGSSEEQGSPEAQVFQEEQAFQEKQTTQGSQETLNVQHGHPAVVKESRPGILGGELTEGASWLRAFEYFGWFMLYVYATPFIGYLAATVLFMVALTWRAGYRDRRLTLAAVAAAFAIVLIFKSFLGVKIPGGAVYEFLPDSVRSFMIINF